jgi:hypothetical protein
LAAAWGWMDRYLLLLEVCFGTEAAALPVLKDVGYGRTRVCQAGGLGFAGNLPGCAYRF